MSHEYLVDNFPHFLRELDPYVYNSNNYVVLDFETTTHLKGNPYRAENTTVLACWSLGEGHPSAVPNGSGENDYFVWGSPYEMARLVDHCERADFIVAHNAKFELGWLQRCGLNIANVLPFCTQIGQYVLNGNRKLPLSLEAIGQQRGLGGKISVVSKMISNGVCPSTIPSDLLLRYCQLDVQLCRDIFLEIREDLNDEALLPVAFTRNIFTPVLVDIERKGMCLDPNRVKHMYNQYKAKEADLEAQMFELSGGINSRSSKQKAEFIYGTLGFAIPKDYRGNEIRTAKDVPRTDQKTLALLKPKTKKQKEFLAVLKELNRVKALLSKALAPMYKCVTETEDGILYATFNQTITGTHRTSSSGLEYGMQFQNLPRIFKPLFRPRHPGWDVGEADEGQLEYRTAVELGDDEAGRHDIENNVDAHGFTASIIFKEQWGEDGSGLSKMDFKKYRTDSKEHTFKPLYGGESGTPRQQEYYKAFKDKHKGIAAAQESWKQEVLSTGKLRTITGLTFYWPDTKVTRSGYITNSTNICNYPVQSLATADIVPIAVTYLWHLMNLAGMESFLVNTVHDSAVSEIHPDERELFEELAVKAMTDLVITYLYAVYGIDFKTPLEAEVEFGTHWGNSPEWEEEYLQ